jgi:hypothetical protein
VLRVGSPWRAPIFAGINQPSPPLALYAKSQWNAQPLPTQGDQNWGTAVFCATSCEFHAAFPVAAGLAVPITERKEQSKLNLTPIGASIFAIVNLSLAVRARVTQQDFDLHPKQGDDRVASWLVQHRT